MHEIFGTLCQDCRKIVYCIRLIESKWLKRKIKCVNTKKNSKMDVSRVEINKLEESLMSEQCESARK